MLSRVVLNQYLSIATTSTKRSLPYFQDHKLSATSALTSAAMTLATSLPAFQHLSLERRANNVFLLTLRRAPENRLNSEFSQELIRALHHVQRVLTSEGSDVPGALVTTSFSEKFFCTGIDLEEPDTNPWAMTDGFYPMLAAFLDFPYPTVACLTGHTFGGGGPLALAHDYRVMNEHRGFFCMVSLQVSSI